MTRLIYRSYALKNKIGSGNVHISTINYVSHYSRKFANSHGCVHARDSLKASMPIYSRDFEDVR